MSATRGFGIMNGAPVPQERTGNEPARIARATERLAEHAVLRPVNRPWPLALASGAFQKVTTQQDIINALQITVTSGTLDIFYGHQDNASQCHMRFTAGDTRTVPLPPQTYDLTFYAAGGTTLAACVTGQALS